MELLLWIPIILAFVLTALVLLVEFVFTPFCFGPSDERDLGTRYLVILVPLLGIMLSVGIAMILGDAGHFGWWTATGLALALTGMGVRVISKRQLGSYFKVSVTIARTQKLIRTGIYSYVRHPLYLGILLIYVSAPLVYGSWWLLLSFTVPSVLSIIYRTAVEERALSEHFGKQWDEHVKKTWWFY